jgi:hypothetical protein
MADEPKIDTPQPETEHAPSLREVVEQAYNEIEETADDGGAAEGRRRDEYGRFLSKEPGEQSSQDPAPVPDGKPSEQAQRPAPQGSSSEAPQHWPAEDRTLFSRQTPEAQSFLLRRHQDMERDYQQKVQASASAVQFVDTIAPIFNDPTVRASLVSEGRVVSPAEAIQQWTGFHVRAMNPDPNVRANLLVEMAQRLQLNPAAVFGQQFRQSGQQQPILTEEELKDPAIRFFADQFGRTVNDLQSLRGELQSFKAQEAARQGDEQVRISRWQIDTFADEVDTQGHPLRPHFDAVLPEIMELFKANPNRDLKEAYETAVWMRPDIRNQLLAGERNGIASQQSNERARQAARSNIRGKTSPVAQPNGQAAPTGLRATIAASADEIGF